MDNAFLHSKKILINIIVFSLSLIMFSGKTFAQDIVSISLIDLQSKGVQGFKRQISFEDSGGKKYLSLPRSREDGLVWLPVKDFQNGTVEIVMRGIDEYQRSFIGIAFHGQNDSTFDAVYCRPFNFYAEDSVRRMRAIQYISHPVYTWEKLRTEHSGMYENEIHNAPDPVDWFRMKLIIEDKVIKAFINNNAEPSLVVKKLNDRTSGKLGIFVADNSGGDFESFFIEYK